MFRNAMNVVAPVLGLPILSLLAGSVPAAAQGTEIHPWAVTFQPSASKIMDYIVWFGEFTFVIIALITIFVLVLIAWCLVKFNHRVNAEPSRVTHNTLVEVLWTVLPIFILIIIAVPSFRLLYAQYDPSKIYADFDPDSTKFLTVKATGYQWYWGYEYAHDSDNESFGVSAEISFDSLMLSDEERGPDDPRLLAVDNEMIVPVGTFVRVHVIGADVIHAFAMPAFGVKVDAVPGRINETYFRAEHEGIFYGQCSELCGKDHAFMPIAIRVVSPDQFETWAVAAAQDVDAANELLARAIAEDEKTIDLAANSGRPGRETMREQ